MPMTDDTATVTLNCGHVITYSLPEGQQKIPRHLAPGHPWSCVPCWNFHGYEGLRYAALLDGEPIPQVPEFTPAPAPAPEPPAEPAKLRAGTIVRYHGSITHKHGEYLYMGLCECDRTDHYEEGCDDDFPNRHQLQDLYSADVILHVRRKSFTPAKTATPDDQSA